jgi:hypothetical protein
VPRAKRTARDRAEARRRYRASLGEPIETDDLEAGDDSVGASRVSAPTSSGRPRAAGASQAAAPIARPGLTAAFRSSFRPIDWRGDLRALPMLVRDKAFYVPVVLSGASVAALPLLGVNPLTSAFYQ